MQGFLFSSQIQSLACMLGGCTSQVSDSGISTCNRPSLITIPRLAKTLQVHRRRDLPQLFNYERKPTARTNGSGRFAAVLARSVVLVRGREIDFLQSCFCPMARGGMCTDEHFLSTADSRG